MAGELPTLPIALGRARARRRGELDAGAARLRLRRRRAPRTRSARTSRRSGAGGSCRGCCATSRARDLRTDGPRARRCPRRCCSRRSACSRSSTPRASWPPRAPPRRWACRWSPQHRVVVHARGDRRGRRATRRAGSSSTGRATASWPRASSAAPRPRATRRSSSRSTRRCSPGARATCRAPTCRSSSRIGIANYLADPVFRAALERTPEEDPQAAVGHFVGSVLQPGDDAGTTSAFLRELTELPILLKGILHPDDARAARERGVDGVLVSNHGGRQVDGAIAALDALPGVVDAVGDDLTVLLRQRHPQRRRRRQGAGAGRRRGAARPAVPVGPGAGGEDGVRSVLRALLAELDLTLALSGPRGPATLALSPCSCAAERGDAQRRRTTGPDRSATVLGFGSAARQRHP